MFIGVVFDWAAEPDFVTPASALACYHRAFNGVKESGIDYTGHDNYSHVGKRRPGANRDGVSHKR